MDATRFLTTLFGNKPPDLHILIWTMPDKTSRWFIDPTAAAAYVKARRSHSDVYVGVSLSPSDFGPNARCPKDHSAGIVGLWADIDIQHGVHKKSNLPPDEAAATEFLDSLGLSPTIVLHSGHGLQAWWLFKEPWIFSSASERREAQDLAKAWNATLRVKASARGWDVDSTWDLARVLRCAGSDNRKDSNAVVPVRILRMDETVRYNPSDFDYYTVDAEAAYPTVTPVEVGHIILTPGATPPIEKLDALRDNNSRFAKTLKYTRSDMQDQSPSGYDMSLATFASQAGWSDQEIADLLVYARRKNGVDTHLDRPDKYRSCIRKAREGRQRSAIEEDASEIISSDMSDIPPEDRRPKALAAMSALIGVNIRGLLCYKGEPPTYWLQTEGGDVEIGSSANLMSQSKMRCLVYEATNHAMRELKGFQWQQVREKFGLVQEDEEAGEEATHAGALRAWIVDYLSDNRPITDHRRALAGRRPYVRDGHVHIFLRDFGRWLGIVVLQRPTSRELGVWLRRMGANQSVAAFATEGKSTTRYVWKLPADIAPPILSVVEDEDEAEAM